MDKEEFIMDKDDYMVEDKCYTEPINDLIVFKYVSSSEIKDKTLHVINCGERFTEAARIKSLENMHSIINRNGTSFHVINFKGRIR